MLATLAARAFQLLEPVGLDPSFFAVAGREIALGARLYDGVLDNKPPLVFWIHAAWVGLAGDGDVALQLLDLSFALAAACLMVPVARWLVPAPAVTPTVSVFSVLLAGYQAGGWWDQAGGWWAHGQAEAFAQPLVVGAVALALGARGPGWVVVAGFLAGMAALAKLTAGTSLVLVAAASGLAGVAWGRALAAVGGGLAAGVGALVLAGQGTLGAAIACTLSYNVAYVREYPLGLSADLLRPLLAPWWETLWPIYTLALLGLAVGPRDRVGALSWLWWALATLEVAVQGKLWTYHYVPLAAPWAILAGRGLAAVGERVGAGARPLRLAALALAALAPLLVLMAQTWVAHRLPARLIGRATAREVLETYDWEPARFSASRSTRIAGPLRALAALVAPDRPATLLVWGNAPELYRLSGARPASRYLSAYHVIRGLSPDGRPAPDVLMADLARVPPDVVALLPGQTSLLAAGTAREWLDRVPALGGLLERDYTLAAVVPEAGATPEHRAAPGAVPAPAEPPAALLLVRSHLP